MRLFTIESWGVSLRVECDLPEYQEAGRRLLLPIWRDLPDLTAAATLRLTGLAGVPRVDGPCEDRVSFKGDPIELLERRAHMYLASETRLVAYVHAGVVKWRGAAILLPGRSFAGKSTLVKTLCEAGATYVSDE